MCALVHAQRAWRDAVRKREAEDGLRSRVTRHVTASSPRPLLASRPQSALQVRALVSYLSTNVSLFRPAAFSGAALRRLVQRCPIYTVSAQQVAHGHYIYVRGVPASCCCLLLHGRVQVCAGNEGLVSDIGAWPPLPRFGRRAGLSLHSRRRE